MDIAEKMAADIALAIDGGDWQDAKWFSKFHREAWIKAVQPYADEIERLREALRKIKKRNSFHNVSPPMDKQYYAQVIVEMVTIANAALKESE